MLSTWHQLLVLLVLDRCAVLWLTQLDRCAVLLMLLLLVDVDAVADLSEKPGAVRTSRGCRLWRAETEVQSMLRHHSARCLDASVILKIPRFLWSTYRPNAAFHAMQSLQCCRRGHSVGAFTSRTASQCRQTSFSYSCATQNVVRHFSDTVYNIVGSLLKLCPSFSSPSK